MTAQERNEVMDKYTENEGKENKMTELELKKITDMVIQLQQVMDKQDEAVRLQKEGKRMLEEVFIRLMETKI